MMTEKDVKFETLLEDIIRKSEKPFSAEKINEAIRQEVIRQCDASGSFDGRDRAAWERSWQQAKDHKIYLELHRQWETLQRKIGMESNFLPDRFFSYCTPPTGHRLDGIRFGAFLSWPSYGFGSSFLDELYSVLSNMPVDVAQSLRLADFSQQAAGYRCIQQCFVARPIRIADRSIRFVAELCAEFYAANNGYFDIDCTGRDPESLSGII